MGTMQKLKSREPRQKVMIQAQMRIGASWNQVCILNISPRGLSMQAAAAPPRGTYLEIRRGDHEIMACVMWANHHRFGVRTQDSLVVDDIIHHPKRSEAALAEAAASRAVAVRTASRRKVTERLDHSRMLSRAMEFAVIVMFVGAAAVVTFTAVAEALNRPLAEASLALTHD